MRLEILTHKYLVDVCCQKTYRKEDKAINIGLIT